MRWCSSRRHIESRGLSLVLGWSIRQFVWEHVFKFLQSVLQLFLYRLVCLIDLLSNHLLNWYLFGDRACLLCNSLLFALCHAASCTGFGLLLLLAFIREVCGLQDAQKHRLVCLVRSSGSLSYRNKINLGLHWLLDTFSSHFFITCSSCPVGNLEVFGFPSLEDLTGSLPLEINWLWRFYCIGFVQPVLQPTILPMYYIAKTVSEYNFSSWSFQFTEVGDDPVSLRIPRVCWRPGRPLLTIWQCWPDFTRIPSMGSSCCPFLNHIMFDRQSTKGFIISSQSLPRISCIPSIIGTAVKEKSTRYAPDAYQHLWGNSCGDYCLPICQLQCRICPHKLKSWLILKSVTDERPARSIVNQGRHTCALYHGFHHQ